MQTEQLLRSGRGEDTRGLSPALQARLPASWYIADSKGRAARLSSAGYVLFFNRSYQLRVAGPADLAAPEVRLVSLPSFLKRQDGPATATKHGLTYQCHAFVPRSTFSWLFLPFRGPYEVLCGDLEIEYGPGDGQSPRSVFTCPVVARTSWSIGIIVLLVVGALAGWLLDQVNHLLRDWWTTGTWPWSGAEGWVAFSAQPRFWLWPLGLALVNPLAALIKHIVVLDQRSRELRRLYEERHGMARTERAAKETA
jgi:hypothetical protein